MLFPVLNGRITQRYSSRHLGWDIAPPTPGQKGVPCVAPESGVIERSSYRAALEGNYVVLRGKSGKYHYFGHFAVRSVRVGQSVKKGQKLGTLGQTGLATAIHTHYEYREYLNGGQINPSTIKWESEEEMITRNGLNVIYKFRLGRAPSASNYTNFVGKKTFDYVDNYVKNSKEYSNETASFKAGKGVCKDHLPGVMQQYA